MTHEPAISIPETDSALDRLNPVERDLLGLLGRGHTAKSIASLRSMSEAAVNERFRSARRKTGIGSSREVARRIVARENRDDFIGLARPVGPAPQLPRPDAPLASPHRWRLPMTAAILIAAAILAQQTAVPPAPALPSGQRTVDAPENPFVAAQRQPDIAALSMEARSGRSDAEWTPQAEARLGAAYRNEPGMSALRTVSVVCSDELCEVLGETSGGVTIEQVGEVIRHAESPHIVAAVDGLKLQREFSSVRTTNDDPAKGWIVSYWRRQD